MGLTPLKSGRERSLGCVIRIKTFVGKVAHTCRVYEKVTCYFMFRERTTIVAGKGFHEILTIRER
jgi:hypothetical protein